MKLLIASLIVFICFPNFIAYAVEVPTITLDGGTFLRFESNQDLKWRDLDISFSMSNGEGLREIKGEFLHPYGEVDFKETLHNQQLIESASFLYGNNKITFSIRFLSGLNNDFIELATLKPLWENTESLIRSNAFQDSYPYKLIWQNFEAVTFNNEIIKETNLESNPVLILSDIGRILKVNISNTEFKDIQSVKIHKINHTKLYPGIELNNKVDPTSVEFNPEFYGTDSFFLRTMIFGITDKHYPLTFLVTMKDKTTHEIQYENDALTNVIELMLPSGVPGWTNYK